MPKIVTVVRLNGHVYAVSADNGYILYSGNVEQVHDWLAHSNYRRTRWAFSITGEYRRVA